jgi:hypothetical protein
LHPAMFHFSNRVKIRKTLKIVLTMNPSLHGERDVNVGSFVWGTTAQRVWGTCKGRIAKRLPKPDFISRWWLQNDLPDTSCMVLVTGWHTRQVNTLNTQWKDGTILCRETIESKVKTCP